MQVLKMSKHQEFYTSRVEKLHKHSITLGISKSDWDFELRMQNSFENEIFVNSKAIFL